MAEAVFLRIPNRFGTIVDTLCLAGVESAISGKKSRSLLTIMNRTFTFILSGDLIGESIDQCVGQNLAQTWITWAPLAAEWIASQVEGLDRSTIASALLEELADPVLDAPSVWMAELIPWDLPDVLHLVVCETSAADEWPPPDD